MAELVDALDSKSGYRKVVQVRFLFWALYDPCKEVEITDLQGSLRCGLSCLLQGVVKRGDDVIVGGKFNPRNLIPNRSFAREIGCL